MENKKKSAVVRLVEKLYGGLSMTWAAVLLLAVGTAVLTAVFLILPVFKDTSFERMGATFEAWFFFAILIMSNCKKPLESALKTFVFFLVSQPLIYLFQVPFSWQGWGLFGYYRYWFIWTLLTFPMAYVGWYITKRNWLSVLILAPVLAFLAGTAYSAADHCLRHFPQQLVTVLFCLGQIALYVIAFFPSLPQKLAGLLAPLVVVTVMALYPQRMELSATIFLPDSPVLTEEAEVVMDENSAAVVTIETTGEDSMVRVRAEAYGAADFTIRDGDTEYLYTVEVYEDDGGHTQIRVTER